MIRTGKQNNSLHKYIRALAVALDDAGIDMRTTIKMPIKPTEENVKECMVKPVMRALYPEIESTTKLSTKQMQELYNVLDRATGQKLGIHVPWPSEESMMEAQR